MLYGGAAGGGKSDALLVEALRQVNMPNYRALILRKTYPQLRELIDRSIQLFKPAFPSAEYRAVSHMWQFPSGARIYFGSMQYAADRYSYQGARFDYIAFDELTHFSEEEYFYMFSRNRPGSPGMRIYMRAAANPGGIGHSWVKHRFIDPAPPNTPIYEQISIDGARKIQRDRIFIPSSVFDNAALMHNAPGYVASLAQLPDAEKRALLYGDWSSFRGQVFTEFVDDISHYTDKIHTHVISPCDFPDYLPVYRSFDFGYSKPYAVGWFIVDSDERVYMVKELYGMGASYNVGLKHSPIQIAERIREVEENDPILKGRTIIPFADPSIFDKSRGESIAEMMEKSPNFIYFRPADNTRLAGKMQVHRRLAFDQSDRPSLYFFNTCIHSIRGMKSLTYSLSDIEDVDTNQEDHLYDVLRYCLMARPLAHLKPALPKLYSANPLDI